MEGKANRLRRNVKKCRICGDVAKAFNYNGLTCEACKNFFRRNEADREALECRLGSNKCVVNGILSRKNCAKCRLERCFSIGMDINMAKSYVRHQVISVPLQHQHKLLQTDSPTQLTEYETGLMRQVLHSIRANLVDENRLEEIKSPDPTNFEYGFNLPARYAKKIVRFCKGMAAFNSINSEDKLVLLKMFYSRFIALRYTFVYDSERDGFPVLANEAGTNVIFLTFKRLENLPDKSIGKEIRTHTIALYNALQNDAVLRDLISAQLLFTPRDELHSQEAIKYQYYVYSRLLRRYLELKYNNKSTASQMYSSLMHILDNIHRILRLIRNVLLTLKKVDTVLKAVHDIPKCHENHEEENQSLAKLS